MDPAALLESLVSIPSISGEEGPIADYLFKLLSVEGFKVHRHGHSLWFQVGEGNPRLLFVSHLDTVPPCEGWTTNPWAPRWESGRLHALGANDAKGCVATLILTAKSLKDVPLQGSAIFAFTAEEETDGRGIRELMPLLQPLDAAVVCEPTGLQVCIAQRGELVLRCKAHGISAHVGHAHEGVNAIAMAARDMVKLESMSFDAHGLLGSTQPVVTEISGGRAHNQVPDRCEFYVALRTTPNLKVSEVVARIAAELESEVSVHYDNYLPQATDPGQPIVQAALESAGLSEGIGSSTASDWAFLNNIPAVKAGPGDTHRSHRPDEWLTLEECLQGVAFYRSLASAYFRRMAE
ncbi:MAG: Peptidase, family [Holophagaceae bacterium]|nr:Peptidase, family [Holophagaceae bacterium]